MNHKRIEKFGRATVLLLIGGLGIGLTVGAGAAWTWRPYAERRHADGRLERVGGWPGMGLYTITELDRGDHVLRRALIWWRHGEGQGVPLAFIWETDPAYVNPGASALLRIQRSTRPGQAAALPWSIEIPNLQAESP